MSSGAAKRARRENKSVTETAATGEEEVIAYTAAERALLVRDLEPVLQLQQQLEQASQRYQQTVKVLRQTKGAPEDEGWELGDQGFVRKKAA